MSINIYVRLWLATRILFIALVNFWVTVLFMFFGGIPPQGNSFGLNALSGFPGAAASPPFTDQNTNFWSAMRQLPQLPGVPNLPAPGFSATSQANLPVGGQPPTSLATSIQPLSHGMRPNLQSSPTSTQKYGKIMGMPTAQFVDRLFVAVLQAVAEGFQNRYARLHTQSRQSRPQSSSETFTSAPAATPNTPTPTSTAPSSIDNVMSRLEQTRVKTAAPATGNVSQMDFPSFDTPPLSNFPTPSVPIHPHPRTTTTPQTLPTQATQQSAPPPSSKADALATLAKQYADKTPGTGWCGVGVRKILTGFGIPIKELGHYGSGNGYAYDIEPALRQTEKFVEVPYNQHQRGDVLVYGPSAGHKAGHTAIAQGNGWEATDGYQQCRPNNYGWAKAFRLKDNV